ncbi:MAG: helix-turn-helix domain-containing protein [Clostridia bacterium]|nr:helix-turn-helix domain-containing protein [Clostridia bacterium]
MDAKFTSNIKKLRKEFNISQLQLSLEIGYGKSIISYWETSFRIPCADAIIILSRYFQVSTDYVLNLTDDNTMLHRIDDFEVDMSTFNLRLKELRKQKNLSQDQLALKTGLTQTSINHWEKGKCIPTADAIVALARYFGVTTDYLLGESD